jgi:hypothetical protein
MRKALYVTAAIVVTVLAYQAWRWRSGPPIARNLPLNIAAADIDFRDGKNRNFRSEWRNPTLFATFKRRVQGLDSLRATRRVLHRDLSLVSLSWKSGVRYVG